MCGILGSVDIPLSEETLGTIQHRGPDGSGLESINTHDRNIVLAHTRLSILDLSTAGHQPMHSKDGRWWVTFNGEIYNHLELRGDLTVTFNGHSDTETLVEYIARYGIGASIKKLNGMFGFAALDTVEGRLYLVRDPFGIKPVYYYHTTSAFAFSSEIKSLRALGVESGVNEAGLDSFLSLRYSPSPSTLHKSIERLAPGHILSVDLKGGLKATCSTYIEPQKGRFNGSLDAAAEVYQVELKAAVSRQLLSDVPVGMLLSGGVDSALVAAMARDAGKPLSCFSVGFGGAHKVCELSAAEDTANVLELPFHAVEVSAEQLLGVLPEIVASVEEPLGTTSIMPMWFLSQEAKRQVKVVLTGQGTDEPWGGYFRYQVEFARKLLPYPGFWRVGQKIGRFIPHMPDAIERGLRALSQPALAARAHEASSLFNSQELQQLTGRDRQGGSLQSMGQWLEWLREVDSPDIDKMMRMDTRMNLSDDLLLYGDKISMASSLEARVPMLDIELVNFVESLPVEYRIGLRKGKIAHKLMAERYLPSRIVHRKKRGFEVPFSDWSRSVWKDYVADTLLSPSARLHRDLDRGVIQKIWNEHLAGKPGRARQVFSLLMLALWYQRFT